MRPMHMHASPHAHPHRTHRTRTQHAPHTHAARTAHAPPTQVCIVYTVAVVVCSPALPAEAAAEAALQRRLSEEAEP